MVALEVFGQTEPLVKELSEGEVGGAAVGRAGAVERLPHGAEVVVEVVHLDGEAVVGFEIGRGQGWELGAFLWSRAGAGVGFGLLGGDA